MNTGVYVDLSGSSSQSVSIERGGAGADDGADNLVGVINAADLVHTELNEVDVALRVAEHVVYIV